jgi:hypothetical protein
VSSSLAASIWLHTVVIYSLVPSFASVRTSRVTLPGSTRFVSDRNGFVAFILAAVFFVVALGPLILNPPIGGYFGATESIPLIFSNASLLFLGYVAFKVVILGRGFWR